MLVRDASDLLRFKVESVLSTKENIFQLVVYIIAAVKSENPCYHFAGTGKT
jgi:hypothetical protein